MKKPIKVPSNQEIAEIRENKLLASTVQNDLITLYKVLYSLKGIAMDAIDAFKESLVRLLDSGDIDGDASHPEDIVIVHRIEITTPHTVMPESSYVTEAVKNALCDAMGTDDVDVPELNQAFIVRIDATDKTSEDELLKEFYYIYAVGVPMDTDNNGLRVIFQSL